MRSKGPVGGKSKLDQQQWRELERVLKAGPAAAGFDAGEWTLARIARVVAERFGVVYHRYGLRYLLHQRGWSVVGAENSAEPVTWHSVSHLDRPA